MGWFDAGEEKEMFQVRFPEEKVPPCCHQSRGRMENKKKPASVVEPKAVSEGIDNDICEAFSNKLPKEDLLVEGLRMRSQAQDRKRGRMDR